MEFTMIFLITFPVVWLISEFYEKRWLRITLGTLSLLLSFGIALVAGSLQMMHANAWYGRATKELIDTAVVEIEEGRGDRVGAALRRMQERYAPADGKRSRYDRLVREAVEDMKGGTGTGGEGGADAAGRALR